MGRGKKKRVKGGRGKRVRTKTARVGVLTYAQALGQAPLLVWREKSIYSS